MRTLVLALVLLGSPALAQESSTPTIVTTGEANVQRAPDVAYIGIAVETRATTPRAAQQQNAEMMTAALKRLAEAGIAKDALKTIGLRVEQEFDYANGRRTSRGFLARNAVEARVDDVAKAGEVADLAVQGGATSLTGIRFELKDRAAAEREALRLAVADARERADAAAAGVGRAVGLIIKIEEARESVVTPKMYTMAVRAEASQAQTPVEAGFLEIRARVVLTVTIR
jgi:uncharacterized protein YggE